jgi:hypothetical protein
MKHISRHRNMWINPQHRHEPEAYAGPPVETGERWGPSLEHNEPAVVVPFSWRNLVAALPHDEWVRWRNRVTADLAALGHPLTPSDIEAAERQAVALGVSRAMLFLVWSLERRALPVAKVLLAAREFGIPVGLMPEAANQLQLVTTNVNGEKLWGLPDSEAYC